MLGLSTPFWTAILPWGLFQAYLVVGLFIRGALPSPGGPYLRLAGLLGLASLGMAFLRRHPNRTRTAALLLGWAVVWGVALLWSVL